MDVERRHIKLPDGRRLSYAEYGDPAGSPAFYFHGTPGGLLEGGFFDEAARRHHLRLIAVDRPGYGDSDFEPGRRIKDWPADVAGLADSLGIERFAVVGLSGGGPHAQACAAMMPDRVTTAAIVSGAGSPDATLSGRTGIRRFLVRATLWLAPIFAWWFAMWTAFWGRRLTERWVPRWIDRHVLARREAREAFAAEVRDALRPGGRAVSQDLQLFARDWRFTPQDAGHVPVLLWHGDADRVVPVSIGRFFAREIPGCEATFVRGGGHLMIVDRADEIFGAVARMARR
jgi:pimeloyl-ACP methyl ester carboxylesterase